MGSSLPRALTLPCREGELQRAKESPSWPSCSSPGERRECGWGLRLEANTAEIAVPFLREAERKRVKGTSEPPLHHLADIYPVFPELRSYGDRSEVEGGMSLPLQSLVAGPLHRKASRTGHLLMGARSTRGSWDPGCRWGRQGVEF